MNTTNARLRHVVTGSLGAVFGLMALAPQGCFRELDAADLDHDGYSYDPITGQVDCAPDDPMVHPGQIDDPTNGKDDDCDGTIDNPPDRDGDGYTAFYDCDDADATVHPGAPEIMVPEGVDDNCDGLTDRCNSTSDCDGDGVSEANGDCDDHDSSVGGLTFHPCETGLLGVCKDGTRKCMNSVPTCVQDKLSGTEECNGLDDDCDGAVDEDITGSGDPCLVSNVSGECAKGLSQCIGSAMTCLQTKFPTAEVCNGLDDDCDGAVDGVSVCNCPLGQSRSCGTTDIGACQYGTQVCNAGAWSACAGNIEPTSESCHDGKDGNCNGIADAFDTECVRTLDLPNTIDLFPLNLTRGDAEFKGNGPDVNVKVTLSRDPTHVYIEACVIMTETAPDCTTANYCKTVTMNVSNGGIISPTLFEVNYRNDGQGWRDAISMASSQPPYSNACEATLGGGYRNLASFVAGVNCIGDTGGPDVCGDVTLDSQGCSGCRINLGSIKIWNK